MVYGGKSDLSITGLNMPASAVTASVGGGYELERAGLEILISSLPGLRVVPMDEEPRVLVHLKGREQMISYSRLGVHSRTEAMLVVVKFLQNAE